MSTIDDILLGLQDSLKKLQKRKLNQTEANSIDVLTKEETQDFEQAALDYINFTYENPTIYHVVNYFKQRLINNKFQYLPEQVSWEGIKPGKYFTIRNGSSLAAFVVGEDWKPEYGIGAIASHIDSLTTLLKPNSKKQKVDGYELLGVAPYSGTLKDLWWDRDLGIGGRLLIKNKEGKVVQKLVDSTPNPIAHIPTLAPHFGAPSIGPFNKETQAVPVIGFSTEEEEPATDEEKNAPLFGKHSIKLLRYISKLANVEVGDILQWDLQLYDVQKGTIGGLNKEFVFAPRVDDRICSFAALHALINSVNEQVLSSKSFSVVALFDNEEVGSLSRQGAKGGLLELVTSRFIATKYSDSQETLKQVYANSIILSADVTHLLNPNFKDNFLENHMPVPNKGVTIALDSNGLMATDSIGLALVEEVAKKNNDSLQYFQSRNDTQSGLTIGTSISSQTGARTIDLGVPQLSMHSIRATVGSKDIALGTKFFEGFFKYWRETYDKYNDL